MRAQTWPTMAKSQVLINADNFENLRSALPASISNRSDARNGAIEENSQQRRPSNVNRQAPDDVVVVGYPIGDPIPPWLWPSVTSLWIWRRRRRGGKCPKVEEARESGPNTTTHWELGVPWKWNGTVEKTSRFHRN